MSEKKKASPAEPNRKEQADKEILEKELNWVSGGNMFDDIPTVPQNDYDENIRGRS